MVNETRLKSVHQRRVFASRGQFNQHFSTAFMGKDPKSTNYIVTLSVFFALFGSARKSFV
jgi:hypothetical protein